MKVELKLQKTAHWRNSDFYRLALLSNSPFHTSTHLIILMQWVENISSCDIINYE